MSEGWVGVDLDGTLAEFHEWRGFDHIGAPIPAMVERVKIWLKQGIEVRIFTARVANCEFDELVESLHHIKQWCRAHIGQELEVTCIKDRHMVELWDDRAVRVVTNTGRPVFEAECDRA